MSGKLNGVDMASYQYDAEPAKMTTTQFCIVKFTQGTWYINPYAERQYKKAKEAGKLLGAYHYAEGGDPEKEASYFVKALGDKVGECVLAVDHEGKSNCIFNTKVEADWIYKFCKKIYDLTKVWPLLYVSKGVTRRRDWSKVASKCGLWCAQYANSKNTNYQSDPWTDSYGFGAWKKDTIRQYSSHGRIRGYDKDIDINLAYLTKDEWMKLARGDRGTIVGHHEGSGSLPVVTPAKTKWSDYIVKTTSPVKISNSGSDENGRYKGGKAGDQTGNEWRIRDWYNRPWNCVLRHPLAEVRACIATLAVKAAENNHIGYDQNQRETYGQALKEAGWDPSKITKNVESDCSKGVIDNIKATGNILGIDELKKFDATYTGNMRSAARYAGFQILTDSKYLNRDDYLLAGDILLNDTHHTCTVITNGQKSGKESATPYVATTEEYKMLPLLKKGSKGNAVEHLQWMLNNTSYKDQKELTKDGSFGFKTLNQVIFYQKARGLDPDGEVGQKTWKKLYEDVF